MAESFDKLATNPAEIVNLNLAFSIRAADKFQRESSFTKQQVMVAFYGVGLDKDPSIASFHRTVQVLWGIKYGSTADVSARKSAIY